ncbi:non-ribosomal peptide synthetase [Streptomyces orinoci]|uniref:Non-ribosomal peptide synthetase n=1 Tax=Streptomyces orinoci TaxID=67339 RepID=A0ABV3JSW6_STRON|nr:non-ribosomal peptide synthetase [Streptomyces orinoci]
MNTTTPPEHRTLHGCFAVRAQAHPDRTAIVHGERTVSYRQLDAWAQAIAARLAPTGLPGRLAAVCAGRSPGTIATLLGVLRAGGAYVPIDPRLPDARLAALIEDCAPAVVLAAPDDVPRLRTLLPAHLPVLPIGQSLPEPAVAPAPPQDPEALAYVIHTSGSTGRPKGVMVEHRSVLSLVHGVTPALREDDVFLQLAPLHVDPSVIEIWGALLNGATLVLPEAGEPGVYDIGRLTARHGVTVLRLAAPLFRLAADHVLPDLAGLRILISGGDRADENAVRRALRALPATTVVNGYGPTETTVYACWHAMRDYDERWPGVPIGRPLTGTTALVLDAAQRPVAPGEEGELCILGDQVARGYLHQPRLTAERFIADPAGRGRRAYLTGDRVRTLPDGSLHFLGRRDDQVKIRGYRVELGEIERTLLAHQAVRQAAVVLRDTEPRLAAFAGCAESTPATATELRAHLAAALPEHMVPATVTVLPALPVTANGKTDRKRLAEAHTPLPQGPLRAPETDTEHRLRTLWQDVLGTAPVSTDTPFLELGGDSLSAMTVLARVEAEWAVRLPPAALFDAPTIRALAARIDAMEPERPPVPPVAGGRIPLLPGQQGVWFEELLAPGGRYNIARTFLVRGGLDLDALRRALTALAERHRSLRTVLEHRDGTWWQRTGDRITLRHQDLSGLPETEREARARQLMDQSAAVDPSAVLFRPLVLTLGPDRALVHFDIHHVIADDWSLDVLFEELGELYRAAKLGHPARLPAPALQYADHVTAELARESTLLADAQRAWRDTLKGWTGTLDLATDFPRPAVLSGNGDTISTPLGAGLTERIARAARRHGVSRFMFCLAAVQVLLSAYTEQDDICLGALSAGRGRAGTERLIGYFVNLLPVRLKADAATTIAELLGRVREACVAGYRHQEVAFQSAARGLGPGGGLPDFQAVVNYQQRPARSLSLWQTRTEPWQSAPRGFAKFELGFSFVEEGSEGTTLELEFSTDLYRRDTMERMAAQLVHLLGLLTGDDTTPLARLDLRCPDERTAPAAPAAAPPLTLHQLFARQAAGHPDKPAVIGPHETLTYRQLDAESDRMAAWLHREGVRRTDRVAICLERSPRLMVAILGVLKAGAAYVPLDPGYPAERLAFTIEDSRAKVLVSAKDLAEELFDGRPAPRTLHIERLLDTVDDGPALSPPPDSATGSDLAYLIYTSGSTGRPRGVMTEHRSVVNTLRGSLDRHPFDETDIWLQLTSPGFDVAAFEQFMPLISGGTVVYCPDTDRRDGHALTRLLSRHRVSVLVTVPSLLRALGRPDLAGVRVLVVAGEPADIHDTRHFARDRVVINGYGPTEAAILATTHQAAADDPRARVPIGTPLPGTTALVRDRHGRPAATGIPGELYLGGAGVARGYWNNPEQTERLFGDVPALGPGRLYRTGDRVRLLADGSLDYLGRLDDQIKLRGFRIELGEVESALAGLPEVDGAAAAVQGTGPDAELLAFVTLSDATAEPAALRDRLAHRLPKHMIPSTILAVDRIPTTSHGKVDRRQLIGRAAELRAHTAGPTEQPATAGERTMLRLWQRVLDAPVPSLDADFFGLGGHSLRIIRLLDLIEQDCGIRIPVRDFLAAPTVRATARLLGRRPQGQRQLMPVEPSAARLDPAVRFPRTGPAPRQESGPVLLTGATGFVGAYLLRELLHRTEGEVICLVRAGSPEEGRRRLTEAAIRYGLPPEPPGPRVEALPGDLALPGLGLTAEVCEDLAHRVVAVFHAGAQVHHLSGYQRLAPANVRGTEELLRIAGAGRPAWFHHLSTLSVFTERPGERMITERTRAGGERHSQGRGYAASKWAAEQLLTQATARGALTRLHRLGRAGAATGNGATSLDDMFSRMLISCVELGCYPLHRRLAFNVLPVDLMARALVALALSDAGPGSVHHLHHGRDTTLAEYLAVHDRRRGTRTPGVPLTEWVARLRDMARDGTELPAVAYQDHLRELAESPDDAPATRWDNRRTLTELSRLGVQLPSPDEPFIERAWDYLDHARATHRTSPAGKAEA